MRHKDVGSWISRCDDCDSPHVMIRIKSKGGNVELCYSCAKKRTPGWEIELHHRTYDDHTEAKYQESMAKEAAEMGTL